MSKQWVQHISGQGDKWPVRQEMGHAWGCLKEGEPFGNLVWLPKSEYRLCPAPEVWRDVTEECQPSKCPGNYGINGDSDIVGCTPGYRLRKVQLGELTENSYSHLKWAFLVEKKVSE